FSLLRDLAIRALVDNRVFFPTLHTLAQLRLRWAEEPLPYKHQETRRSLASRLLKDIEKEPKSRWLPLMGDLLRQGLRGPADSAIAEIRRMRPTKKAHGA